MSSDAIAGLHDVFNLLRTFEGDGLTIRRAGALEGAAEKVTAASLELIDVTEPEELPRWLQSAVKALQTAEKAARAHRRNPLTRPISHTRFALNVGIAQGGVHLALAALDPENTPPVPESDKT
ncbi:hypothetical protein [Streptomyces mayteni]